ncbi:hypothetical protein [Sphingomonas sp.]|uniref:hypothetical protein n=1 Tax=Sphingomonas sp. TaxID=28214 RepID=UPI003B3B1147
MARNLKVYRTPIGFHDAYVAAPSQKAALKAWGSDADLFARGIAEVVTDDSLTKEPLANPGKIVKRARGNAEDYAAVPPSKRAANRRVRPTDADAEPNRRSRSPKNAAPPAEPKPALKAPKRKPKPRPSRSKLEAAEQAIETANSDHAAALADLRRREQALRDERRQLDDGHAAEISKLETALGKVRTAYQVAIEKWASDS